MANYTKATNFATKDTLPTGDPGKIVKGTEIDNEFNAISSAISSKADSSSPTFTGTPAAPTATAGTNTTQLATTAFTTAAVTAERTATVTLTNKTLTSPTIASPTITSPTVTGLFLNDSSIVFEGSSADAFETTLTVTNPTADRTLTLPNATDTLVGRATADTLTNKTINASQLVDGSIATAKIANDSITADKLSGSQTGTAPIFGARAWVNFDGTGTDGGAQTIRASGNVTSVTRSSATYTITMTTAMPSANYTITGSSTNNVGNDTGYIMLVGTPTTTSFQVQPRNDDGGAGTCSRINLVVFG